MDKYIGKRLNASYEELIEVGWMYFVYWDYDVVEEKLRQKT